MALSALHRDKLTHLLQVLLDPRQARVVVEPNRRQSGFWFGGGNVVQDVDGTLWLSGRYRNVGDSRLGLEAGERGLECALFASRDGGTAFQKVRSWTKADLSRPEARVISIEGTALQRRPNGNWELYVSSEKAWDYPSEVREHLKPGCGVWSIDVLSGPSPERLDTASLHPVLREADDPAWLHVKDPVVYTLADGTTHLIYCSHPYCWSSANTGLAVRAAGADSFSVTARQLVPRGPAWDVAGTRVTCRFSLPRLGVFASLPPVSVLFYDGLECVRQHEENRRGVHRPRGYSCEELGGAMAGFDTDFPHFERLSHLAPLFVSPEGSGCCRYADVAHCGGHLLATWQQSQADLSQPLVGHALSLDEVANLLA